MQLRVACTVPQRLEGEQKPLRLLPWGPILRFSMDVSCFQALLVLCSLATLVTLLSALPATQLKVLS